MKILYRKHVNGVGTWKISGDPTTGLIIILHASVMGGAEVRHEERVTTNLSGRSLVEQVDLRIKSRIGRMLDRGYKWTMHDAEASPTNQLGLKRPMLAKDISKVTRIDYRNAILQKKLDGHRCLITKQDGELIAYSRQGKFITSISHILGSLQDLPDGVTLDGELYKHGVPLQTLASWIKRAQPESQSLWYVVYDTISNDPFLDRFSEVEELLQGKPSFIKTLKGRPFESSDQMWSYHTEAIGQGFEGLILRTNDRGYEDGARSSSLIKVKKFLEMEVVVRGITESKEGWAILHCSTPSGYMVGCSAPGTMVEKKHVLDHKGDFIGKQLTIKYSVLTKDQIPFHPTALRWRVDV